LAGQEIIQENLICVYIDVVEMYAHTHWMGAYKNKLAFWSKA
jgi:hypothetical protein